MLPEWAEPWLKGSVDMGQTFNMDWDLAKFFDKETNEWWKGWVAMFYYAIFVYQDHKTTVSQYFTHLCPSLKNRYQLFDLFNPVR